MTLLRRLSVVAILVALALAGFAWVIASPLGAAADDDYHLASIWCRTAGDSSACETRYTIDGNPTVKTSAAFQKPCFAGRSSQSAECQEINSDLAFTDRINVGGYPGAYYTVMHVFASDRIVGSALLIRAVNFGLFLLTIGLTFWLASPRVRRSMVAGLSVTLIPVGIFFLASSNPSSWTITGIALEFFALLALGDAVTRWRPFALAALAALGAALAAMSRGDAGAYAIAVAGIGGWMIWPTLKSHLWRGLALVPPVAVGCYSFLGASQSSQGYGDTPFSLEAAIHNLLDILLVPLGNLGLGRMGSLGWLDTPMPAATWGAMALALGAVVVSGIAATNFRSGLAAVGTALLLVALPWYMLQKYGYLVGEFVQPRYVLPLLIVLLGILALTTGNRASLLSMGQSMAIACCIAVAHAAALYANLLRYTGGAPTDVLGFDSQWWWDMPVGPVAVWVTGSLAFGVAIFALFAGVLAPAGASRRRTVTEAGRASRAKGVTP